MIRHTNGRLAVKPLKENGLWHSSRELLTFAAAARVESGYRFSERHENLLPTPSSLLTVKREGPGHFQHLATNVTAKLEVLNIIENVCDPGTDLLHFRFFHPTCG